jgi:hypothetical protein
VFGKFKKLLGSSASSRIVKTNLDGLSKEEQMWLTKNCCGGASPGISSIVA